MLPFLAFLQRPLKPTSLLWRPQTENQKPFFLRKPETRNRKPSLLSPRKSSTKPRPPNSPPTWQISPRTPRTKTLPEPQEENFLLLRKPETRNRKPSLSRPRPRGPAVPRNPRISATPASFDRSKAPFADYFSLRLPLFIFCRSFRPARCGLLSLYGKPKTDNCTQPFPNTHEIFVKIKLLTSGSIW